VCNILIEYRFKNDFVLNPIPGFSKRQTRPSFFVVTKVLSFFLGLTGDIGATN
jgi:hypothetical protein